MPLAFGPSFLSWDQFLYNVYPPASVWRLFCSCFCSIIKEENMNLTLTKMFYVLNKIHVLREIYNFKFLRNVFFKNTPGIKGKCRRFHLLGFPIKSKFTWTEAMRLWSNYINGYARTWEQSDWSLRTILSARCLKINGLLLLLNTIQ